MLIRLLSLFLLMTLSACGSSATTSQVASFANGSAAFTTITNNDPNLSSSTSGRVILSTSSDICNDLPKGIYHQGMQIVTMTLDEVSTRYNDRGFGNGLWNVNNDYSVADTSVTQADPNVADANTVTFHSSVQLQSFDSKCQGTTQELKSGTVQITNFADQQNAIVSFTIQPAQGDPIQASYLAVYCPDIFNALASNLGQDSNIGVTTCIP